MSSAKNLNRWGVLVKVESSYGSDPTPAAGDDGVLVVERPEVDLNYAHDGSRGSGPATRGPLPRTDPSGLEAAVELICEGIGSGSAYESSTPTVPHLDALIRAAGLSSTIDETTGSEKVTYAIEGDTGSIDSVAVEVYVRQQLYQILGGYAAGLTVEAEGPMVPTWTFPIQGIGSLPTDVALPDITSYPPVTRLPGKLVTPDLSFNGVTSLNLRSFNLDLSSDLSQRLGDNTTIHAGFTPGNYEPTLELTFEAVALSTLNPYQLRDQGTSIVVNFDVGQDQYNRFTIDAQQAKVVEVSDDDEGSVALWTVTLALEPSGYNSADQVSLIFD